MVHFVVRFCVFGNRCSEQLAGCTFVPTTRESSGMVLLVAANFVKLLVSRRFEVKAGVFTPTPSSNDGKLPPSGVNIQETSGLPCHGIIGSLLWIVRAWVDICFAATRLTR